MKTEPSESSARELRGTVLCIEDQPISMALVEAMLAEFPGIRLLKAADGHDGVRIARSESPDLVLLDMRLPDISGLEVVRILNEEIAQRQLRVVLLTADTFSMDVIKAMSLGAHDYWYKPLTRERLRSGLANCLKG